MLGKGQRMIRQIIYLRSVYLDDGWIVCANVLEIIFYIQVFNRYIFQGQLQVGERGRVGYWRVKLHGNIE